MPMTPIPFPPSPSTRWCVLGGKAPRQGSAPPTARSAASPLTWIRPGLSSRAWGGGESCQGADAEWDTVSSIQRPAVAHIRFRPFAPVSEISVQTVDVTASASVRAAPAGAWSPELPQYDRAERGREFTTDRAVPPGVLGVRGVCQDRG